MKGEQASAIEMAANNFQVCILVLNIEHTSSPVSVFFWIEGSSFAHKVVKKNGVLSIVDPWELFSLGEDTKT